MPPPVFASRVSCVGNRIQFAGAMFAETRPLGEVLAEQTIGVLVAASLPGALPVAKVDVETSVDPELGVSCNLGALIPGQGSAQVAFLPGEAFQFDCSEDYAILGGERTKLKVAHMKLAHSRAFLVRAYPPLPHRHHRPPGYNDHSDPEERSALERGLPGRDRPQRLARRCTSVQNSASGSVASTKGRAVRPKYRS